MGWLTKLFGNEGTIRFEAKMADGRTLTGKTKIESIGLDQQQLEQELANAIYVETGIRCISCKITGYYGS